MCDNSVSGSNTHTLLMRLSFYMRIYNAHHIINVYIYIERERRRERKKEGERGLLCTHIYAYIIIHIHTTYLGLRGEPH